MLFMLKMRKCKFQEKKKKQAEILKNKLFLNGVGWHYLPVKKLPALLRRIAPKTNDDFYWLNFLHLFSIKSKLESRKANVEIKIFVMLRWLLKTLELSEFNIRV